MQEEHAQTKWYACRSAACGTKYTTAVKHEQISQLDKKATQKHLALPPVKLQISDGREKEEGKEEEKKKKKEREEEKKKEEETEGGGRRREEEVDKERKRGRGKWKSHWVHTGIAPRSTGTQKRADTWGQQGLEVHT